MTLEELRREVALASARFGELAEQAADDDFAPWIVEALREAELEAAAFLSEPRIARFREATLA